MNVPDDDQMRDLLADMLPALDRAANEGDVSAPAHSSLRRDPPSRPDGLAAVDGSADGGTHPAAGVETRVGERGPQSSMPQISGISLT